MVVGLFNSLISRIRNQGEPDEDGFVEFKICIVVGDVPVGGGSVKTEFTLVVVLLKLNFILVELWWKFYFHVANI